MTKSEGSPKSENRTSRLVYKRAWLRPDNNSDFGFRMFFAIRHSSFVIRSTASLVIAGCLSTAYAQQTVPPQQDPLINLMLSQPPIELNGPVVATASFDPPVIAPGQQSIYRVTFNALGASIQWPAELPADPNLGIQRSAEGEVLQVTAGAMVPTTSFNYRVHPTGVGGFVVTQFVATVYG